ncbi:MAG: hypothetical protein ACR2K5_05645 [Pseudolabrys sp.]
MYDHIFSNPPSTPQQIDDAIEAAKAARSDALRSLLREMPDLFRHAYARIKLSSQGLTATAKRS